MSRVLITPRQFDILIDAPRYHRVMPFYPNSRAVSQLVKLGLIDIQDKVTKVLAPGINVVERWWKITYEGERMIRYCAQHWGPAYEAYLEFQPVDIEEGESTDD